MNKKIKLRKDTCILFCINILVLFLLILFNIYYTNHNYNAILIKIMLILNVLILVFGIILNIILVIKDKRENKKNSIIAMVCYLTLFILINIFGSYYINLSLNKKYSNISNKIIKYCNLYDCIKYETINKGLNKNFIIYKNYYDYDSNLNDIVYKVEYNTKKIIKITSEIYSENELFSEELIYQNLNEFYTYFNEIISKDKIKEAFNKRFIGIETENNITYKVEEIYKNEKLYKIKTTITVKK